MNLPERRNDMSDEFQNKPRLIKGAFVEYTSESLDSVPNIITFQYNPTELSREITPPEEESRTRGRERRMVTYPPSESITLSIVLDATDKLEKGDRTAITKGVYPTLAALELLIHHQSQPISTNPASRRGRTERSDKVIPHKAPVILFVWGLHRILPVRIQNMSIRETAFDSTLNPIRAEVTIRLEVLTPEEFKKDRIAQWAYTWTQKQKETLAKLIL